MECDRNRRRNKTMSTSKIFKFDINWSSYSGHFGHTFNEGDTMTVTVTPPPTIITMVIYQFDNTLAGKHPVCASQCDNSNSCAVKIQRSGVSLKGDASVMVSAYQEGFGWQGMTVNFLIT